MDVITVETKAFKELMAKINVIANYVFSRQDDCKENEDDIWVDSYEVCTFLKISDRTLQRLRSKGEIAYSTIRGRNFYKIGEIKRLLESRLIKSNDECMRNLITNHKLYVKERRNRGSRNLVGISIYLCQPKKKKLSVCHSMQICPKEFNLGVERFGCRV